MNTDAAIESSMRLLKGNVLIKYEFFETHLGRSLIAQAFSACGGARRAKKNNFSGEAGLRLRLLARLYASICQRYTSNRQRYSCMVVRNWLISANPMLNEDCAIRVIGRQRVHDGPLMTWAETEELITAAAEVFITYVDSD